MNIKTILVDDEDKALQVLQLKLLTYCPQVTVVGTANSPASAYDLIVREKPQLLFLDVAMPQESGFDLLKRLPRLDFELIFVTGFDNYALDAIRFSAIGYVLKPVQTEDLIEAVQKAEDRIAEKMDHDRNKRFVETMLSPGNTRNRIGIPSESGLDFVPVGDIIRCEGFQKYTMVYTQKQGSILSSYNIGEFRKLLEDYGFYAIHKSHLINMEHIKRFDKEGTVIMTDDATVPVSRRKRQEFLDQLTRI